MNDYFEEQNYVLERIWFDYLGGRYVGNGFMSWEPDAGFHIEAILKRHGKPLPSKIEFGKIRVPTPEDIRTIRIKPLHFNWAIIPNVSLRDNLELLLENRLSINVDRVLFSTISENKKESKYFCSILYETKGDLRLSHKLREETYINEQRVKYSLGKSGIWYDDKEQKISGYMDDEKHLKIFWTLDKSYYSKRDSCILPRAAKKALSMMYGQTLHLLKSEVHRGNRKIIEVRRRRKVKSLGILSPFGSQRILNMEVFLKLTDFFIRNDNYANICLKIFSQMTEAARQQSRQATELLLSTILEAALRTLYNKPFLNNAEKFDPGDYLNRFFKEYLLKTWNGIDEKVMKARKNLRHRNAHPDWLYGQGGSLSPESVERSVDDMIILSRFYGFMILALAGFKGLKPAFPSPQKDWSSLMTIEETADKT